jgi:sterol desaturase/sphingolipid hydroxylase (fatty acid hydroxylase superfamily)
MSKQLYHPQKGSIPRLFQNRVLEAVFAHVHFTVPLALYLPLIAWVSYRGLSVVGSSALAFAGLFAAGLIAWTLFEYALHRWVLHWIPDTTWGLKFHFWMHGIHHDYPQDTRVVPPGRSIPGFALLAFAFWGMLGPVHWHGAFAGFVLGYLLYEMVHYGTHNLTWSNRWFKKLQNHHMYHHYRNSEASYGFTGTIWDWLFKTRFQDIGDAAEPPQDPR